MNTAEVFDQKQKKWTARTKWQDIKVGDIIKVNKNEYMPADLVVVDSSGKEGVFYVETKGLDGETNLKLKTVDPKISHEFDAKDPGVI